jgi:hypothetical protein
MLDAEGVIPDDSMEALGAFVATSLGLSLETYTLRIVGPHARDEESCRTR